MRTLAIGDIHGCATAFEALLDLIAPTCTDAVVTLGDYVDRGPDAAGVLNRLLRLARSTLLIPIRGNHEEMMLDARQSAERLSIWKEYGGDATLRSYSPFLDGGDLADVPDDHWEFLERSCRDYHETGTHIFVHASLYPDMPLAEQPNYILRWETFDDPPPHESGKTMVCGHTPQKQGRPRNIGHAVCIDTAAHSRDGWLTCLEVETGRILQANQAGKVRASWLDEYLV